MAMPTPVRTAAPRHQYTDHDRSGLSISVRDEVLREGDAYVLCHALGELPRDVAPGVERGNGGHTHANKALTYKHKQVFASRTYNPFLLT